MLQITGRESYEKYGNLLGIDLAGEPDLAISPLWSLKIAAEEWKASNCNALADQDKLRAVTLAFNGGYVGLASRADWLAKAKSDFEGATQLAHGTPPKFDLALFHCQQAIEKVFKAFLTWHDQKFRYPGEPEKPTQDETREALEVTREALDAILKYLPTAG